VKLAFDKTEAKAMAGRRLRAMFIVDTSLTVSDIVTAPETR